MHQVRLTETHTTVKIKDRKSTRLNSSHLVISYAVFCLKKKNKRMMRELKENRPAVSKPTALYERASFRPHHNHAKRKTNSIETLQCMQTDLLATVEDEA